MSAIVLAGGRSERFGAADKLGATLDGMPLLHHPVVRLAAITDDIVVVLRADGAEPAMPSIARVRYARDRYVGEGPLAGAVAGLAAVDREIAVIAGGDMPSLSAEVLREMVRVASTRAVDAVALQEGDRVRPLPVVVRSAAGRDAGHALLQQGERSLRAWLQAMHVALIGETAWTAIDPARETLRDVDVPRDLEPG